MTWLRRIFHQCGACDAWAICRWSTARALGWVCHSWWPEGGGCKLCPRCQAEDWDDHQW